MPYNKDTKHKRLTLGDRQETMGRMDKGMPFKAMARRTGKDPAAVSKEAKKHIGLREAPGVETTKADGTVVGGRRCPLPPKAPFVRSPCGKRGRRCPFQKRFRIAKRVRAEYGAPLVPARDGAAPNKEEFWEAGAVVAEGVKKGRRPCRVMEPGKAGFKAGRLPQPA